MRLRFSQFTMERVTNRVKCLKPRKGSDTKLPHETIDKPRSSEKHSMVSLDIKYFRLRHRVIAKFWRDVKQLSSFSGKYDSFVVIPKYLSRINFPNPIA